MACNPRQNRNSTTIAWNPGTLNWNTKWLRRHLGIIAERPGNLRTHTKWLRRRLGSENTPKVLVELSGICEYNVKCSSAVKSACENVLPAHVPRLKIRHFHTEGLRAMPFWRRGASLPRLLFCRPFYGNLVVGYLLQCVWAHCVMYTKHISLAPWQFVVCLANLTSKMRSQAFLANFLEEDWREICS